MTNYPRPIAGQPATLIMSEGFQGHLVDLVNAYFRGELTKQPGDKSLRSSVMVSNNTGASLKPGQLLAVDKVTAVDAAMVHSWKKQPAGKGEAIVWHDNIAQAAIVENGLDISQIGPLSTQSWAAVEITSASGDYVFIDPDDPTRCKSGTGGFAKIVMISGSTAIVDRTQQQNLWRAELTDGASNAELRQAKLLNLDGTEFAASITILDPGATLESKDAGDVIYCLNAGNRFYPLGSAEIDCTAICEKCGVFANEDGTCDEPPPTGNGCCDYDSVTSGDRCNYNGTAITNLQVTVDGGPTYTQVGESRFASEGNFCSWTMQVQDDNGDQWGAQVDRLAQGWRVFVSNQTGSWEKLLGPTNCTGSESGLTNNGTGDASFSYQNDGDCPAPPITACNEQLTGTLYPRVRVSGYPASFTRTENPPITWTELGSDCDGTLTDEIINTLDGVNGTFLGPAFIENPAGGNLPPVPPTDFTDQCNEISVLTQFKLTGAVQCNEPDTLCADDRTRNHFFDWSGARFYFAPWGVDNGDVGNCAVAAGSGVVDIPTPTCEPGGTWRDISFTVSRRLRRIQTGNPLTWQCWQILIEVDYVQL